MAALATAVFFSSSIARAGSVSLEPLEIGQRRWRVRQIRDDEDLGTLLEQRHDLVVDFEVANAVREAVDAGAQQFLGVGQVVDVSDDAQPARSALRR